MRLRQDVTSLALIASDLGLAVTRFLSGPLGGDQQIGAGIVEGRIDFVSFFWAPLEPHPHDVDVRSRWLARCSK